MTMLVYSKTAYPHMLCLNKQNPIIPEDKIGHYIYYILYYACMHNINCSLAVMLINCKIYSLHLILQWYKTYYEYS